MMISDSLPQMWLIYFGLAAVVLFTGYMAVRILPRFLRWILVGGIAGMIAMPTSFHVPASVAEDAYTGLAPAIVAFAVSVVQKDGGGMASAFGMLVLGIGAGVVLGLVIWWLGRGREQRRRAAQQRREPHGHEQEDEEVREGHVAGASLRSEKRGTPARASARTRAGRDRQEPSL